MRFRLVALLLALLLPLQFVWSAAAAYCQHEPVVTGAAHLGHHEHHHKASEGQKSPGDSRLMADADCGVCHAPSTPLAAVLPTVPSLLEPAAVPVGKPPSEPASVDARAPERPQWGRLA